MTGIFTATDEMWMDRQCKVATDIGERALNSDGVSADTPDSLVVRPLLPGEDLDSGADNGWTDGTGATPINAWVQDWTSGGATADAFNEAYSIEPNSQAQGKIIGVYGLSLMHTTVDEREIQFKIGGGGEKIQVANIESLENDEESRGLLMDNVYYDVTEHGSIEFWLDDVSDGNRVGLHGFVAESVEETISRDTFPIFTYGQQQTQTVQPQMR